MISYLNGHSKCFITNGHFRLIYIDVTGSEGGEESYHPDGRKRLFKTITREFNPNDVMLDGGVDEEDGKEEVIDASEQAVDEMNDHDQVPDNGKEEVNDNATEDITPKASKDLEKLIEASKQIKIKSISNKFRSLITKYYGGLPDNVKQVINEIANAAINQAGPLCVKNIKDIANALSQTIRHATNICVTGSEILTITGPRCACIEDLCVSILVVFQQKLNRFINDDDIGVALFTKIRNARA